MIHVRLETYEGNSVKGMWQVPKGDYTKSEKRGRLLIPDSEPALYGPTPSSHIHLH